MCALLSAEAGKPEKVAANLQETRRLGIPILPPDVNRSDKTFTLTRLEDGRYAIVYGLLGIKGIGEKAVDEIIRVRGDRPYESIEDFLSRVDNRLINRGVMATLIQAGAFDSFDKNRFRVWNWYHFTWRKDPPKKREEYERYQEDQWAEERAWAWERELMGNYISGHPLQDLPSVIWDHVPHNGPVEVGGILLTSGFKEFKDRKGREMAMGRIETMSGLALSFTVFGDYWPKVKDLFVAGAVLVLRGKKDAFRNSIVVSSVVRGDSRRARKPKSADPGASAPPAVVVPDPLNEIE